MKRIWRAFLAVVILLSQGLDATAAVPAQPRASTPVMPARLDKADLDRWLDSFLPKALSEGAIPGAAVVVVKDGQVLTERGYGYADLEAKTPVDPAGTVFRLGSVTKLFTWTAVMQQVAAGRLDLDRDINAYLDFRVPPYRGRPVTLRELMTHTAGFEEHMKQLFVADPSRLQPLRAYVAGWQPKRIYPPGEVPAYSNYAAGLAAYIVQRASGERFEDYLDRHLFAPLAMTRSTVRQPVPQPLQPRLARSYRHAGDAAQPFEWVNDFPAGGMSATADDMAHFMIAELDGGTYAGGRLLPADAVEEMQRSQNLPPRPFPTMGLGFIPTWRNGHAVVGHDGDLQFSKTVLYLMPKERVGVFLALNSGGVRHAAFRIRTDLMHRFLDRYFPAPAPLAPVAVATARAHGREIAGLYASSRTSASNAFALRALIGQERATARDDGRVEVTGLETLDGAPELWTEVAPYLWANADGRSHMAAVRRDGRVVALATEDDTTSNLIRVPWWRSGDWNLPLLHLTLLVFMAALVLWPVEAVVRRLRRAEPLSRRRQILDVFVRLAGAAGLGAGLIYNDLIGRMARVQTLDTPLDAPIHLAQALSLAVVVGAGFSLWNLVVLAKDPQAGWWSRLFHLVLSVALLSGVWLSLSMHLLGPSTGF